jgi:hypothetical protein
MRRKDMPISADILLRRVTHFVLWRPKTLANAPQHHRAIATWQPTGARE